MGSQPPMSSSLSKRNLDDYADEALPFPINPIRMRKVQSSSSNNPPRPRSSPTRLQFFVRILSDHTLVLHADASDTIKFIHEKIQAITGIPLIEQRIIYRGKQLQWEQTLSDCQVQNDAGLHLVGRMRSTGHPQAWQLINEAVSKIFSMYKENPQPPTTKSVKSLLADFLTMTPRTGAEQASGHLQIFSASSAPAALVMLYMSSHKPNRAAADEAIRQFIASSKTVLLKDSYHDCVPIILEFCDLLKRAAGIDDPLYSLCRSSLGAMLEYIEFGGKKGKIEVRAIFPFVNELAAKLSHDLVLSIESLPFPGPSLADINDFSSFVVPVRNKIKGDVGFDGPIRVPLSEDLRGVPHCFADEIRILHGIFDDLLSKLERCLEKIEGHMNIDLKQDTDAFCVGSCYYLAIMKELNSISKIYSGCEGLFWETMKRRKSAFCYLIVKCAKRSDDHNWILECKEVTNFEARRHLAMLMLPEVKDEYGELHEMLIDRSQLLAESFE